MMGLYQAKAAIQAAVFSAAALAAGTTASQAQFVDCPKPIAHCVHEVSGWCEKDNGKIVIVFRDKAFSSETYQQCLGKVYEKHGRPNPYAPPSQQKANTRR